MRNVYLCVFMSLCMYGVYVCVHGLNIESNYTAEPPMYARISQGRLSCRHLRHSPTITIIEIIITNLTFIIIAICLGSSASACASTWPLACVHDCRDGSLSRESHLC